MTMRFSKKLSLIAVSVLLANCGVATDESVQNSTNASTDAVPADGSFDSRAGLQNVRIETKRVRVTEADIVATAINYLADATESMGNSKPEFTLINATEVDAQDGLSHVRLQQVVDGLPVWGADSVVHLDDTNVLGATGAVARSFDKITTTTALTSEAVLAKAKQERFGRRAVATEQESVEKILHVADDGTTQVAFHTSFYNEIDGDLQPAFWHHIYDANTGVLLARWNAIHTLDVNNADDGVGLASTDPQASGVGGNAKVQHSWNNELDVSINAAGAAVLTTSRLTTLNMNNGSSTGVEVTGTLTSIGDAPINDAHGFAEITLNFLQDWMGRNSIDDRGFVIKSRVHYSRNYENAFWNGTQMTYGDGASKFYPLSGALDVCAHEIDHGFTSKHSNLTYAAQSGGLNEGFSDIAGKTAEAYYRGTVSWDLGADVFKTPNAALRYMCDPTKDGRSIDNAANYRNGMDPHYSSGVPNKAFCLSSKRISSGSPTGTATQAGVKRAAQAYYLANASYWTSGTTYVQGCQGVLDAARALNYTAAEVTSLKQSWADVGVVCN